MAIHDMKTEYRSTKEIVISAVKGLEIINPNFKFKIVFELMGDGSYYSINYNDHVYEMKVTMKKERSDEIVFNGKKTREKDKNEILDALLDILKLIPFYRAIGWHEGKVKIYDMLKDYEVSAVRKKV